VCGLAPTSTFDPRNASSTLVLGGQGLRTRVKVVFEEAVVEAPNQESAGSKVSEMELMQYR
jgi:hypothetical protein